MKKINLNEALLSKKNSKSISKRLWLIMISIFLVIILFFMVAVLIVTTQANRDYEITEANTRITSVKSNIQSNLDNYKDVSRLIMLNEKAITFLRADNANAGIKNDAHYGVMDVLHACKNVDSVFIFRNDGEYMSTGKAEYLLDRNKMEEAKWQNRILEKRGGVVIDMNGNGALFRKRGPDVITISRTIYDILTQKKSGTMLMNISINMLSKVIKGQDKKDICILDTSGNYLAGDTNLVSYFSEQFLSEENVHIEIGKGFGNTMISGSRMKDTPLVILCSTTANVKAIPMLTLVTMIILLVIFLIAVFLATVFISRDVTRPIVELTHAMEETKKSGYLQKLDVNMPANEIGELADSYNSMIAHLNDLIKRLIEKEKAEQQAEMRVLHEQIKPHFLYNSLETISYLAMEAGADKVHTALETLGSFYRNFLSKGSGEITLRREINIIQDYLALQKLRYGDIIIDEYEIEEETLDYKIPKLLLQPLVENCIYHGIRPKGEEGIIRITSYLEGDVLHLKVYDSGVGMDIKDIERILDPNADDNEDTDSLKKSFGLRGTIERVRYYSNDRDTVKIKSELGEYTEIEIIIREGWG